MKKILLAAIAMGIVLPAAAQDTYESARLLGSDLNGTARYVGMGGAMEALGADISTMGTNPAGIGLFRHSTASLSFGVVSQADAKEFDGLNKTNMSFDQAGFVYSARVSPTSFINVGFNYHKSKNFDQLLSIADHKLNGSANGLTYRKWDKGYYNLAYDKYNYVYGYDYHYQDRPRANSYSQMDDLNVNGLYMAGEDKDGLYLDYNDADLYNFDRSHRGWISDYDFNISGNSNDRFYWGITLGIKDVNYKGYSEYMERLNRLDESDRVVDAGTVTYGDERRIKGTGFDIKAGIIFRPVEYSPFRIGLSIATPTWYELTSSNNTEMLNNTVYAKTPGGDVFSVQEEYEFHYHTPWKFGASIGHTVGSDVAFGISYEYSDYGASKNRIIDGYDYYDNAESSTDEPMKRNTEDVLKGVHTLKAGVEIKPSPEFAVRFGANYISAAYNKNGVRDATIDSPGVMYSSTTDYTNWKDTYRLTCGLGYKSGPIALDMAYQYSTTNGEFHPFQPYAGADGAVDVSNKRHQLLLTIGYTF
ncbi:MAG: hemin receptor [Prevotella sp.]|nr:hemin receptor [Prevotella sp.]